MVQNSSKILFSGTIPASLFLIELVKMQIWVHGTPLPMTGPVTDEPTGARLSQVRPGSISYWMADCRTVIIHLNIIFYFWRVII